MESKNKKDMSVDELVKQLKLVLDIDESEEEPEPEKETETLPETEDGTPAKSVGEVSGADVGEELDRLFDDEKTEKSKRKKKRKLFGRRKKEEDEDGDDIIDKAEPEEPEKTEIPAEEEKEEAQPAVPETEEKKEGPEDKGEQSDAWLDDALSGIFAEDAGETETAPETDPVTGPEEVSETETEPEETKETEAEPEETPASAQTAQEKTPEETPEEAPEEAPEEPFEDAAVTEEPEEFDDDDVTEYVNDGARGADNDTTVALKSDDPFVSDVFSGSGEDDGGETKTVVCGGDTAVYEDHNATIRVNPEAQTADPGDIIDEDLLSDIEKFDVIYSDKNEDADGYSTADEAIMDAFAEKQKPSKKKKRSEAEELDDIFSAMPAAPVGGKSTADDDIYEEVYTDEFTSYDQRKTFLDEYKKKYGSLKKSLIASSLVAVILFVYELLPLFVKELPYAINRTENPSVFTLIGLALFSLCAAFAAKHTFSGFRSVFKGNTTLSSMTFLAVLFTYIYGIIVAVNGTAALYPMMSVSALTVISMLAAEMRIVKRRTLAFRVISGAPAKNKFVLERYQSDGEKTQGSALGAARAQFISRFAASNIKRSNAYGYLNLMFPLIALIFIVFFTVGMFVKKDVSYAVSYGFTAGIFCIPVAVFPALSLPSYLCSKKAYGDGSCVVSDAEAEKYTSASVVFFEDTDVFPPSHDKITSVRLYNDSRMDHIMYIMMSVFGKLGGPLLVICENAAKEYGSSSDVEITKTEEGGVEARVDSLTVRIGSAGFMGDRLEHIYREDDGMYENSENERIMYMSVNGTVAAKFYIEYGMDPEFKKLIKQLSNAERAIAIRTLDPNIDDALLSAFVDTEMYNCRITAGRSKKNDVRAESCGTVVSKSSVKSLMRTLLLCDKTVYTSKINALICFLSLIIGLLITVFLMITGSLHVINVIYATAYQLIVTAAVRLITRLHI